MSISIVSRIAPSIMRISSPLYSTLSLYKTDGHVQWFLHNRVQHSATESFCFPTRKKLKLDCLTQFNSLTENLDRLCCRLCVMTLSLHPWVSFVWWRNFYFSYHSWSLEGVKIITVKNNLGDFSPPSACWRTAAGTVKFVWYVILVLVCTSDGACYVRRYIEYKCTVFGKVSIFCRS